MGGQDDHVSNFGDWGAPSPSPRTFFSSILADDINSRSILGNNNNMLFPGPFEGNISSRNGDKNESSGGLVGGELTRPDMYTQPKMNSRGGLVERMAARAGFNAPKLNTEGVRPTGLSQNQESRSSFLTIPSGLSPTTLLESPVFLSNALAQPSPTTGNFPFSFGVSNTRNFSLAQEGPDKSKENFYGDINTSSFVFKPVLDSGPSSFLGHSSNNFPGFEVSKGIVISTENLSPPDDQQDEEGDQPSGGEPLPGGAPAEDGYNWRKYGQKQVKGSEYPRSYYKCTHPNCPVKKKIERSQEGHITEIIYKGAHNHPKPPPNRRSGVGMLSDMQADVADQIGGAIERRHDSLEVTSSASVGAENLQVPNGARFESGDVVDGPSAFSNDDNEEEDDRATHGSASLGYDGEEDESESKRRKVEAYAADMSGATRAIREPRVVVQTTSEVDILDDGYRWRKYGQKVVKGNPNPRSYYKCTHAGCTVRKHVERASHDLKSVITTYEGKHNHEVPAARNSSHHNSGNTSNGPAHHGSSIPAHLQRPDTTMLHTAMARFDGNPSFGRQQLGSSHGFSFGMSQPGLANLAMAGMGPDLSKFPVIPAQMSMGQQQNYNEMGFMLPKGEPKVESLVEAPMNFQNGSSVYQQMMSRLPLGP